MAPAKNNEMSLSSQDDVVMVRQTVRKIAQEIGLSLIDQTKIVTAASELARNAVVHGQGGTMKWERLTNGTRTGLSLTFADDGPGISDIDLAMKDGWTSSNGLGMGLPGAKRLVNEFNIESARGKGTRVTVTRWK